MAIVEDQSAVRRLLVDALGRGSPAAVEVIETHISVVVLGGGLALKLKRAVRLPYADFSTPERRLAACERELALNRRTAPRHYLRVRRITREGRRLAFEGDGPLVDAVVEMRRFDQSQLFDRLAAEGGLTAAHMEALAAEIARLHAEAAPVRGRAGAEHVAAVLAINEAALAGSRIFEPAAVACFNARFCEAAERRRALLDARARAGRVRRCHGDLHLGNIFLEAGRPVLFDCIEFNDALATSDVLYDLAFLLMDLRHRGRRDLASVVMNRTLDLSGDEDGLPLLPFFMALRAAVRAHVAATAAETAAETAEETAGAAGGGARREAAQAYFDEALALLEPAPVGIVAVGGLSGSGKSTVAAALAPLLGAGARVLSSDRIRKSLLGAAPEARLPPEAYDRETNARVYRAIVERAGAIAAGGSAVVADAVFARPDERAAIAAAAGEAGVPFRGFWLEAPAETLRARVAARRGGPSDAGPVVLERQLGYDLGRIDWTRLDARREAEDLAAAAADCADFAAAAAAGHAAARFS
jgi:uncharacterized protein